MTSGALGTSQLGKAQLGAYNMLDTPGGTPPVTPSTVVMLNAEALQIVDLPNVYIMMGQWHY